MGVGKFMSGFIDSFKNPETSRTMKVNSAITMSFIIFFPLYFLGMPSLLPDGATISESGGSGTFSVSFEEQDIATFEETQELIDGEEYEFMFTFTETGMKLGYVEVTVSHDETDESGPTPDVIAPEECDNAIGEMKMEGVNGFVESGSTLSGESTQQCPSSYTMLILLTENYSGTTYEESGSMSAILAQWTDNGNGRGDWNCKITLETRTGSTIGPSFGPMNNNEDGETVTVSWRVVSYTVKADKVIDIGAE